MMESIEYSSLHQIPLAYASCSIGCEASDTLPRRLEAIGKAGFTAIELSFPDILAYGEQLLGHEIPPDDYNQLTSVAGEIRTLCKANHLSVLMLQPFANFEGWPKDSPERRDAFERAAGWIEIMKAVGTDMLQVHYSFPLNPHQVKSNIITGWSDRYTSAQSLHRSLNDRIRST
jgi:sugar phosphate isomerase/epimerase